MAQMTAPEASPPVFDASKLFSSLDEGGRRRLIEAATRMRMAPGEVIVSEGDVPDAMYIVLQGELQVTATSFSGGELDVSKIETGAVFGEIGVMTGEPRNATVTAVSEGWLMRLAVEDVRAVLADNPEISGDLMRLSLQHSEATLEAVIADDD